MGEAVMVTDPQTVIQRVNASFTQITGYTEADITGHTPRFLTADRHDDDYHTQMWDTLRRSGRWVGELWYRCRDGAIRPLWHSVTALRDEHGKVSHYVAVLNDLTEIRRAQEAAERLMWRDPLTGLANRAWSSWPPPTGKTTTPTCC
jgi:PAS domain S-box-containing protein